MNQKSNEAITLKVIAHIRTAFPTKFGIPRQSGLVDSLRGEIIFTPEYRNADAVRGLEDFSHIWLVWQFSGDVVADGAPAPLGRQHPDGRVRHPLALPAQPLGPFQREAGGHRNAAGGGAGAAGARG